MPEEPRPQPKQEDLNVDAKPASFADVFQCELAEIGTRQDEHHSDAAPPASPRNLAGLALSGGGIRSATLSLGVLQALNKVGLLKVFDYLSTVSGGGYIGAWWSAWTSRDPKEADEIKDHPFFPPEETISQQRIEFRDRHPSSNDSAPPHKFDPVHHVRLFSNYLTPIKGLFSGETWAAATIISRNMVLTWVVLIPILFAAVMLAQLWFTLMPGADWQFMYPYTKTNADIELKTLFHKQAAYAKLIDDRADSKQFNPVTDSITSWADSIKQIDAALLDAINHSSIGKNNRERSNPKSNREAASWNGLLFSAIDSAHARDTLVLVVKRDSTNEKANVDTTLTWQERRIDHDVKVLLNPREEHGAAQEFDSSKDNTEVRLGIRGRAADDLRSNVVAIERAMVRARWSHDDRMLFTNGHSHYLKNRLVWGLYIPIGILAWLIAFTILWMLTVSSQNLRNGWVQAVIAFIGGAIALALLGLEMPKFIGGQDQLGWDWDSTLMKWEIGIWMIGAVWMLIRSLRREKPHSLLRIMIVRSQFWWRWLLRPKSKGADSNGVTVRFNKHRGLEYRRQRIINTQKACLVALVASIVFLAFGGFGHEGMYYVYWYSDTGSGFGKLLGQIVGIAGSVVGIVGSAALAWRGFSLKQTNKDNQNSAGLWIVLAKIIPPVILLLLLGIVSWFGHYLLAEIVFSSADPHAMFFPGLQALTYMLGLTIILYAWDDMHWEHRKPRRTFVTMEYVVLFLGLVLMIILLRSEIPMENRIAIFCIMGVFVAGGIRAIVHSMNTRQPTADKTRKYSDSKDVSWHLIVVLFSFIALSIVALLHPPKFPSAFAHPAQRLYFACACFILLVLILESIWGSSTNNLPRVLAASAMICMAGLVGLPAMLNETHASLTYIVAVLITLSLEASIFVGWRVDPNALSLHSFYRSRLVRAYLGASNAHRAANRQEIKEFDKADEIPLANIKTCQHGAPYHLINTTLNELGGNALNSAQRHASNFLLSQHYCGCAKTGYRPTGEYMKGDMMLGTAAAISGAAASPAMGSREISGSVAALMSLLNVRLGFWAPNPRSDRWQKPRPRVWPYYLLKESLQQTNNLGNFCYLTDGGHFDNTGLYSLVQRGCKYILFCDNTADQDFDFEALGIAIRRCRIDFGAEIKFEGLKDILPPNAPDTALISATPKPERKPWLCGTIEYKREHLELVWNGEHVSEEDRKGIIILFKPMVPSHAPADLIQYDRENKGFPHQSEADQWFDETQFESYRKLGEWITGQAFPSLLDPSRKGMVKLFEDLASAAPVPIPSAPSAMAGHSFTINVAAGGAIPEQKS